MEVQVPVKTEIPAQLLQELPKCVLDVEGELLFKELDEYLRCLMLTEETYRARIEELRTL